MRLPVEYEQFPVCFASNVLLNLCFFAMVGRVSLGNYAILHIVLLGAVCIVFYIVTFTWQHALLRCLIQFLQFVFFVGIGMILPLLVSVAWRIQQ